MAGLLFELGRDPAIGHRQALFQRHGGFPTQYFAQSGVVAVSAPDSLRLRHIVTLADSLARDLRDHVDELIDRDHSILAEVDRLAMLAAHQAIDSFDAVVDVAIGARLFAVAPHLN